MFEIIYWGIPLTDTLVTGWERTFRARDRVREGNTVLSEIQGLLQPQMLFVERLYRMVGHIRIPIRDNKFDASRPALMGIVLAGADPQGQSYSPGHLFPGESATPKEEPPPFVVLPLATVVPLNALWETYEALYKAKLPYAKKVWGSFARKARLLDLQIPRAQVLYFKSLPNR